MLFRVLGPGLVIFQGVRCTTGDCRPRQATGALHSLWRARRLIDVSFELQKSGMIRAGHLPISQHWPHLEAGKFFISAQEELG